MNEVYVKQYDENGNITNPIKQDKPLVATGPNRRQRRFYMRDKEDVGLIVYNKGGGKDKAFYQFVATYTKVQTTTTPEKAMKSLYNKSVKGFQKYKVKELLKKDGTPMVTKTGSPRYEILQLTGITKIYHCMPADAYAREIQAANKKSK